jgi:hypothetical protein
VPWSSKSMGPARVCPSCKEQRMPVSYWTHVSETRDVSNVRLGMYQYVLALGTANDKTSNP